MYKLIGSTVQRINIIYRNYSNQWPHKLTSPFVTLQGPPCTVTKGTILLKFSECLCLKLIDLFASFQIALATENSIILQNLDFVASGSYSCEVSLDTPIFTKASSEKQLTVFRKYYQFYSRKGGFIAAYKLINQLLSIFIFDLLNSEQGETGNVTLCIFFIYHHLYITILTSLKATKVRFFRKLYEWWKSITRY